jgi:hypothetical protein
MMNSALAQNVPREALMGNNRRRHAIEAYQLSTFCRRLLISAGNHESAILGPGGCGPRKRRGSSRMGSTPLRLLMLTIAKFLNV